MERDFLADFLGVLERDLLVRLGVRGDEGDLVGQTRNTPITSKPSVGIVWLKITRLSSNYRSSYLLEDFLVLDRGESLWEVREEISFENDRSDLSDRSERGEEERPRRLLLRVGLGEPLWRRFLSTGGDKRLSDGKLNKSHVL